MDDADDVGNPLSEYTIKFDHDLLDLAPETCPSHVPFSRWLPLPPYTTKVTRPIEPTRIMVKTWLSQIAAQSEVPVLTTCEVEKVLEQYKQPHEITTVYFVNKHSGRIEVYKIAEEPTLSDVVDAYQRYSDGSVDFVVNTKMRSVHSV